MKVLNKPRARSLLHAISGAPVLVWALLGFSATYLLFFVAPVFLSAPGMQFIRYVPAHDPIGGDLKLTLSFSESWALAKQTPYIGFVGLNPYPPLAMVLFTPLLWLQPAPAYWTVSLATILCYALAACIYSLHTGDRRREPSLLALVFVSGLFAYGFQFELERGQFNLIAASLGLLAVWIYHYRNRYRYLAYVLFSISVQLKLFPLVYIVLLTRDCREWRDNIKRLLGLGMVNFALLFVLGPQVFVDWFRSIRAQGMAPYVWEGNHSIRSFVIAMASQQPWIWARGYSKLIQAALVAVVAACISFIVLQAYRRREHTMNPYLLLACTIAALLIPSSSHDYTLSFLAIPFAVLLSDTTSLLERTCGLRRLVFIVLILVLSFAYSSTLFSFRNKPAMLGNNLPALFAMLLATTCLSVFFQPSHSVDPVDGCC